MSDEGLIIKDYKYPKIWVSELKDIQKTLRVYCLEMTDVIDSAPKKRGDIIKNKDKLSAEQKLDTLKKFINEYMWSGDGSCLHQRMESILLRMEEENE